MTKRWSTCGSAIVCERAQAQGLGANVGQVGEASGCAGALDVAPQRHPGRRAFVLLTVTVDDVADESKLRRFACRPDGASWYRRVGSGGFLARVRLDVPSSVPAIAMPPEVPKNKTPPPTFLEIVLFLMSIAAPW